MSKIVVVGSINMDIVNRVIRHPVPGETIHGIDTHFYPGGKGANQAVAAAKSGGNVVMIGGVGGDAFGQQLLNGLRLHGINERYISVEPGNSGIASITVDESGENVIILTGGANQLINEGKVIKALDSERDVGIMLCQNEIPWETTQCAIEEGHKRGIRVIYNPAPARKLPKEVFSQIDTMILNETEASQITGIAVDTIQDAQSSASILLAQGVQAVIVTLGKNGSLYVSKQEFIHMPAFTVEVNDTTAAGDTFIGAYAVVSMNGFSTKNALQFATAASAIAVSRSGAQHSIPSREEVVDFLYRQFGECESESVPM